MTFWEKFLLFRDLADPVRVPCYLAGVGIAKALNKQTNKTNYQGPGAH